MSTRHVLATGIAFDSGMAPAKVERARLNCKAIDKDFKLRASKSEIERLVPDFRQPNREIIEQKVSAVGTGGSAATFQRRKLASGLNKVGDSASFEGIHPADEQLHTTRICRLAEMVA